MRPTNLSPADRLIVSGDFRPPKGGECDPSGRIWVFNKVQGLTQSLKGTGVTIKGNSALRANGYGLIDFIHSAGLRFFADLKLYDIEQTLGTDGVLIGEAYPEFVTVSCCAGVAAMKALVQEIKTLSPNTEVLGITVPTSFTNDDALRMFGCTVNDAVLRLGHIGADAALDGLVAAATEAPMLRAEFGDRFSINTPGIRPDWAAVKGDDQNKNRVMTPGNAIQAGADRIVVGRPIVEAVNPPEAVRLTIAEIQEAMEPATA